MMEESLVRIGDFVASMGYGRRPVIWQRATCCQGEYRGWADKRSITR